MRLSRIKFAKNTTDLIRRKFSIDAILRDGEGPPARPPFRNHIKSALETCRSPSLPNDAARAGKYGLRARCFASGMGALAFA